MKLLSKLGLVSALVAVIAVIIVLGLKKYHIGIFSATESTSSSEEILSTGGQESAQESTEETAQESAAETTEETAEESTDTSFETSTDVSQTESSESAISEQTEVAETTAVVTIPESTVAPAETTQAQTSAANTYRGVTLPIPSTYPERKATVSELAANGAFLRKSGKVLYLVFTIGVEYGYTPLILDVLKEKGVVATFMVGVGQIENDKTSGYNIFQRMVNEGHLIGNHGATHTLTANLSDSQLVDNILNTETALSAHLGYTYHLQYYMPPEGTISMRDLYVTSALGITTVGYSWNYYDYNIHDQMTGAEALEKMKGGISDGCILYLHSRPCTYEALADFIDYARSLGYTFQTIDK